MADNRPTTREEARQKLITALQDNARKLRKAYADNDKAAIDRYSTQDERLTAQLRATGGIGEIGAGIASTAVGLLTGLPDIVISGYNAVANPLNPVPTLRERILTAAGIPTEATSQEASLAYNAPDVAVGVTGLAQLTKLGVTGVRDWLKNRQTKELLSKLPEQEQNFFSTLMLKGQGSPNAEIAAQIAKLERDPKYAELFNTLQREASVRGVSGLTPAASKITEEQAAVGSALGVQNKLAGLSEARKVAGDSAFTKAFGYGEGRQLVDPKQTLTKIDELIGRYSAQKTPNAVRATEVLQSIRESLQPTKTATIPGAVGGTATRTAVTMERDATGMLRPVSTEGTYQLPRTAGTTVNYKTAPELLTPEQVQSVLSEFGKKASQGDSLIKDLAISDEKIISSAIFGGMKDDLANALKAATGNDKVALGMLIKARKEISDASNAYADAISQGLPAWLKDKRLSEINFEDLYAQYKTATPTQRATFRSYIENTEPEALKNLDSRVWSEFTTKYQDVLPDGLPGLNLARMSQDWAKMSTVEKDAVAAALGQKTSDFTKRMEDALVFTRRVRTGQPVDGADITGLTREASAVVGATPAGYQGAKITQLVGDAFGAFRKGVVSNDLAMKTLLTPQGAEFLKTAKLSPGSRKTLEALTQTANTSPKLPSWMAVGTAASNVTETAQGQSPEAQMNVPEEFNIPEEFKVPQDQTQQMQPTNLPATEDFIIPAEFNQKTEDSRMKDRGLILNTELAKTQENLQNTTDPVVRGRLERDVEALTREIQRFNTGR
jgi:hypothetical protein